MNGPVGRNAARRPLPRSGLLQQVCVYDQVLLAAAKTFFRWCVVEKKWLARNALEVVKDIGRAAETGAGGAHRREARLVRRRPPQHLGELQSFPNRSQNRLFNPTERIPKCFRGAKRDRTVGLPSAIQGGPSRARAIRSAVRAAVSAGSTARIARASSSASRARPRARSASARSPRARLVRPRVGLGGGAPDLQAHGRVAEREPGGQRGAVVEAPGHGERGAVGARRRARRRPPRRRSRPGAAATRSRGPATRRAGVERRGVDAPRRARRLKVTGISVARDERREAGPPRGEDQPVGGAVDERPALGIEQRRARVEVGVGDERGGDAEAVEQRLPLGARQIVAAEDGVERRGVAVDARVLEDAVARPALPGQVRADLEVVVHPVAQAVVVDEPDGGRRTPGRARGRGRRSARRGARRRRAARVAPASSAATRPSRGRPAPRRSAPARAAPATLGERTATIGPARIANSATKRIRRAPRRPSASAGQQLPPAAAGEGGRQRATPRGDEEERSVDRPARRPVLLQRAQRTASASGWRCSPARPRPTAWRR